jgi:hypothetical protein
MDQFIGVVLVTFSVLIEKNINFPFLYLLNRCVLVDFGHGVKIKKAADKLPLSMFNNFD